MPIKDCAIFLAPGRKTSRAPQTRPPFTRIPKATGPHPKKARGDRSPANGYTEGMPPILSLDELLHSLPPHQPGDTRLFRIEPGRRLAKAAWLEEAIKNSGAGAAEGRWFTDNPEALPFYLADQEGLSPRLVVVDLPSATAQPFRVDRLDGLAAEGLHPKRFSRDPEREFFLPPEMTRTRHVHPISTEVAPSVSSKRSGPRT